MEFEKVMDVIQPGVASETETASAASVEEQPKAVEAGEKAERSRASSSRMKPPEGTGSGDAGKSFGDAGKPFGTRFSELTNELALEVDRASQLQTAFRAAESIHRLRGKKDPSYVRTGLTRTSVLLGLLAADPALRAVLGETGLSWDVLVDGTKIAPERRGLEIGADIVLTTSVDFTLHPHVADAIRLYAERWAHLPLDTLGLTWALLQGREGRFDERLRQAGLDMDAAEEALRTRLEDAGLQGSVHGLPVIRADDLAEPDRLSVERDYQAMASVIASTEAITPLAIGIFGHWGSGKSFFMEKLRGEIEKRTELARSARKRARDARRPEPTDLPFVESIVPVRFNAWHYMDGNLWPNLVVHIFDSLAEHINGEDPDSARAKLLKSADIARRELTAAEAERDAKKALLEAAERQQSEVKDRMLEASDFWSLTDGVKRELVKRISALRVDRVAGDDLGATLKDLYDEARVSIAELQGFGQTVARLFRGTVPDISRAGFLGWPIVLGAVALLVSFPLDEYYGVLEAWWSKLMALLTPALAAFSVFVRRARTRVEKVRALIDYIDQRKAEHDAQSSAQVFALHLEAAQVQARVSEAKEAVRIAEERLIEATSGKQLQRFLQERSSSNDYRQNLGMIAQIRHDFEQLERLFGQARDKLAPSELPPIDRIVLYIDDLDRCPRDRVLEVIQAVHLLLATKLFVVLVAMDPRWLKKVFSRNDGDNGATHWLHLDGEDASAENYLEKIFQVPYTLPGMTGAGFESLLEHLTGDPNATEAGARSHADNGGEQLDRAARSTEGLSAPSDVKSRTAPLTVAPSQTPRVTELDEGKRDASTSLEPLLSRHAARFTQLERQCLAQFGPPIIRTPRATKRLVNSYRFIRATFSESELASFLRPRGGRAEFSLVIAILALSIGFPTHAGAIMRLCRDGNFKELEKHIDAESRRRFEAIARGATAEALARAVSHVQRYSFVSDEGDGLVPGRPSGS